MLFVGQSFSCKLCSVTVDKLENSLSKSEWSYKSSNL